MSQRTQTSEQQSGLPVSRQNAASLHQFFIPQIPAVQGAAVFDCAHLPYSLSHSFLLPRSPFPNPTQLHTAQLMLSTTHRCCTSTCKVACGVAELNNKLQAKTAEASHIDVGPAFRIVWCKMVPAKR